MTEPNSKSEKPEDGRRFDPELLKKGLRCDMDQYEMLKRCSDIENITEWNEWRNQHSDEKVLLEGADLSSANLKGVALSFAYLKGAEFEDANLEEADFSISNLESARFLCTNMKRAGFMCTRLKDATLIGANLAGAGLIYADLKGANFEVTNVDGGTHIINCEVNRYRKNQSSTNFECVGIDSARIDSATKQLIEYNIRRKNWEGWYRAHLLLKWPVKWFWSLSDYGLRTWRIIIWFFGLAALFAVLYRLYPNCIMVYGDVGDIRGFWHALYFSVVTMTTLGFGDIAANPDSWVGQTLLMIQVILGYVLLGALVTRFAVLFTAGGPAGKFADEKEKEDEKK